MTDYNSLTHLHSAKVLVYIAAVSVPSQIFPTNLASNLSICKGSTTCMSRRPAKKRTLVNKTITTSPFQLLILALQVDRRLTSDCLFSSMSAWDDTRSHQNMQDEPWCLSINKYNGGNDKSQMCCVVQHSAWGRKLGEGVGVLLPLFLVDHNGGLGCDTKGLSFL